MLVRIFLWTDDLTLVWPDMSVEGENLCYKDISVMVESAYEEEGYFLNIVTNQDCDGGCRCNLAGGSRQKLGRSYRALRA